MAKKDETDVPVPRSLMEGLRDFMNRRFDRDRLMNYQLHFIHEIDLAIGIPERKLCDELAAKIAEKYPDGVVAYKDGSFYLDIDEAQNPELYKDDTNQGLSQSDGGSREIPCAATPDEGQIQNTGAAPRKYELDDPSFYVARTRTTADFPQPRYHPPGDIVMHGKKPERPASKWLRENRAKFACQHKAGDECPCFPNDAEAMLNAFLSHKESVK